MSDTITLLFTSDLHGRVEPTDPVRGEPFAGGAARAATLLACARDRDPRAIYLDLGDLVQGTPMSTLAARSASPGIHPMVRVLTALGCRGMVVGNHEFNFGIPFLEALRRGADFPLLGANVLGSGEEPHFDPVLRLEVGRRRVAVLALVTPQVPRWEEPWNFAGLTFRDAVETAREWVPRLRQEADAVVVAAHMGWDGVTDGGLEEPVPPENDVGRLVREVDDIDAVLMAHTHRFDERRATNGTLVVQAGWGGLGVGELRLEWPTADAARPDVSFQLHRTDLDTPPDPEIRAIPRVEERAAEERMQEEIGQAAGDFTLCGLRYRDNAILSLFHRVQLDAAGTDLSSAVVFRAREELAAGAITGRDVFRIYPYENDLTILELTVDDVRSYLEEIAQVYTGPARNGGPPPLHPRIGLHNHDALAGCTYVIDPSQPAGRRVVDLRFPAGELPGDRRLSMAVSSYRAQGGGGYRALRRGRVVERTGRDLRERLEAYIRSCGTIAPETFDNWRVLGAEPGN